MRVLRRASVIFSALVLVAAAGFLPMRSAQAAGSWHKGWCQRGEGLAVVISYQWVYPSSVWATKADTAQGYAVRCILKSALPLNYQPDKAQDLALTAAGIPHVGSLYVTSIFGIGPESTDGYVHGVGTIEKGWWQENDLNAVNGVDGFQYWFAIPQRGGPGMPVVQPQFAQGGGPAAPNPNPGVSAPQQTYQPVPHPGPGQNTAPAPGEGDGGDQGASGPGGAEGSSGPGSTGGSSAGASTSPGASASASASASGSASASASASAGKTPEGEAAASAMPSASPSAIFGAEPAGAPGASRQAKAMSEWRRAGLAGAVALVAGGGAGYWFWWRRKRTRSDESVVDLDS